MKTLVREKIWVLYNMQILKKKGRKHDVREKRVKRFLMTAQTEIQLDNMMHDVVAGNITLNEWLRRKELEAYALQTAAR